MDEIKNERSTGKLEGLELDVWVARAIGWYIYLEEDSRPWALLFGDENWFSEPNKEVELINKTVTGATPFDYFHPSHLWEDGGPLLDEHKITVEYVSTADDKGWWHARKYPHMANGPSYLVAAMRVLVASRYGDTLPPHSDFTEDFKP